MSGTSGKPGKSRDSILVTGAAGYVGAHAALRLLRGGHRVIGLDNFSTGKRHRIRTLTSLADDLPGAFEFVEADIAETARVAAALTEHGATSVMHFAAHCIVSESVELPEKYRRNNIEGTAALLGACAKAGVTRFILSSTTAVYGDPDLGMTPIPESTPCQPINPYGESKLACEGLLRLHSERQRAAGKPFASAVLRYFNVAGCDAELGEQSNDAGRLIPAAISVANGERDALTICGTDFPTPDGTAVRDYIDVRDVAEAHVAVFDALKDGDDRLYNLGMGRGWSVREVALATARVTSREIPTIDGPRRPGDPASLVADASKINDEIGWTAQRDDIDEVIASVWAWARSSVQSR